MICNAVYDNEADVPAAFKADFHRRADGKWVMNDDAVPGAAELLNPGLATNRDRALAQKTTAEEAKRTAETRARDLETELSNVRAPGAVVLNPEDAKAWKKFTELGDVKTVERIVKTDFPALQQKETLRGQEESFRQAVEDLKPFGVALDFEVLRTMMTHPQHGEGVTIERRMTEVVDEKGTKTNVNLPFVVKRVPVAGKENEFTNEATILLDYASTNWPAWATTALTAGGGAAAGGQTGGETGGGGTGGQPGLLPLTTGNSGGATGATGGGQAGGLRLPGAQPVGLKLPALGAGGGGGGAQAGGLSADPKAVAEEYNKARDAGKVNPLTRGRAPQQQQQSGGGDAAK